MYHYRNAVMYRFTPDASFSDEVLSTALDSKPFTPRSRHEWRRTGWAEPFPNLMSGRTQHFNGANVIDLQLQEAILPAEVVRKALDDRVSSIERTENRTVYRKERATLKDEVLIMDLLPRALSRDKHTRALLMPAAGMIVVDASSLTAAETLLSELREALGSLRVRLPEVNYSPAAAMSAWLMDPSSVSEGFALGTACKLQDTLGDEKGAITVKNEDLTSEEIRAHIQSGMQVTRLALCWEDQLTFTLHDDLTLHGIRRTDEYRDQLAEQAPEDELAAIDADVTQMSLEYQRLFPALFKAFGGEQQMLPAA